MQNAPSLPCTMKAWVCNSYGGPEVLSLVEKPVPTPAAHEVLVKLAATTVSSADARVRALNVPKGLKLISRLALGWFKPRNQILGTEFAGTIVDLGQSVAGFKVGDRVSVFEGQGWDVMRST